MGTKPWSQTSYGKKVLRAARKRDAEEEKKILATTRTKRVLEAIRKAKMRLTNAIHEHDANQTRFLYCLVGRTYLKVGYTSNLTGRMSTLKSYGVPDANVIFFVRNAPLESEGELLHQLYDLGIKAKTNTCETFFKNISPIIIGYMSSLGVVESVKIGSGSWQSVLLNALSSPPNKARTRKAI